MPNGRICGLFCWMRFLRCRRGLARKCFGQALRGANPAGDENPERDVLHGEGQNLGPDRDHRHIDRPQLDVARQRHRDGAEPEHKHQRRPGVAGEGDVFRDGLGHDRRHVAQHPAALEHDRADRKMRDRGFGQHETRIAGQQRRAAEHDHQRQAGIGHEAEWLALDAGMDHLGHRARDRHACRQHHIAGGQVQSEEHEGGKEVGAELDEYVPHGRALPFGRLRARLIRNLAMRWPAPPILPSGIPDTTW